VNHDETPANVGPIARFLDGLIYFFLLATLVLTAIPYGTIQPWWIALFECLVFVTAMLVLIEAMISKRWFVDASLVVPLLFLILFALVQSIPLFSGPGPLNPRTSISADPYGTRLFAIQLFALTLVVLLLRRYVSSKERLRGLIYVVIGVGAATALFGIARQNLQHGPGFVLPALPVGRGFGQFINRNHFALLLEMTLGLTLGMIVGEKGKHRRVFILIPIGALLWCALIYSNSRGGIIASFCQLLFLLVLLYPVRHLTQQQADPKERRFENFTGGLAVRAVLIVCLIGLFAYGVSWIGGERVVSNFQLAATDFSDQEMENNINTSRKQIWAATWEMFKAHPLTGLGFGGYWIGITRYHHASGEITPQQAHNDYLELLASGGVIGCALTAWFLVIFFRRAKTSLRSQDSYYRAACLGAITGMFGVVVHSFVDFGMHITINALLFCALLVIAVQADRLPPGREGAVSSALRRNAD
jgi:O-antigen ligase